MSVRKIVVSFLFLIVPGVTSVPAQEMDDGAEATAASVSVMRIIPAETLRSYHPTSLFKALQMVVPGLMFSDVHGLHGDNPNYVVDKITIRGEKGIQGTVSASESLPLLIIDGYSVSTDRLHDFDIDRVESVAILNDATATALYGIRAAGGVIVIVTRSPQGDTPMQLKYNFDGTFSWANLQGWDFMSAAKKLELENSAGMYAGIPDLYQERKDELARRGEYDWLKEPLRSSFVHRHRLAIEGGNEGLMYRATLLAQPGGMGVMEKTKRQIYGASALVDYIADKFTVSNELQLDLVYADNDYISLADWGRVNRYYYPYDDNGKILSVLGELEPSRVALNEQNSPYYEYTLNSFNKDESIRILNNFRTSWSISDKFELSGWFTFTRDQSKVSQFLSPTSTRFDHLISDDADMKGEYQIIKGRTNIYEERLMLGYSDAWDCHWLKAGLGIHGYAATVYSDNFSGVGIASNHMDYISFASYYPVGSKPGNSEFYHRELSGLGYANYAYKNIWNIDLAGRIDRSSRLAPEKRVAGSWSVNALWNAGNEDFMNGSGFLTQLSLSVGYGSNAGYQFDYDYVNPTYGYSRHGYYMDAQNVTSGGNRSLALLSLGQTNIYNDRLKWKTNNALDATVAFGVLGVISGRVQYYDITTKNLVGTDRQDPVYGYAYRIVNGGEIRNSGLDVSLGVNVNSHYVTAERLRMNIILHGTFNRNEYKGGFSDYFIGEYNDAGIETDMWTTSQLVKGNPVDGLYAYRSAGIDANDGKEYFYKKDGTKTLTPELSDLEYMGDTGPKFTGMAGFIGSWRNFDFSCILGYSFGGKIFNMSSAYYVDWAGAEGNLPKEAAGKWTSQNASVRWQGFDANRGYVSSRFIETNNVFSLSTVSVGYKFNIADIDKMGLKSLRATLTGNNLLYVESGDRMRGLSYPYTRSATLSLQAIF